MKTIVEYLVNNHIINFRKPDPLSLELVYDYNDEAWELKAYTYLDNHEYGGCGGIKTLLEEYDMSGAAADDIEISDYSAKDKRTTIYVGVVHHKNKTKAAFLWGSEGVYYKK